MLLAIEPSTRVCVIICCHQGAIALSLVLLEEALVAPPIRPIVNSEASSLAVDPLAGEFATVGPLINPKSINLVVDPGALIRRSVRPLVYPVAILLALGIISMERLLFCQYLDSDSLTSIFEPGAVVSDSVEKPHLADPMPHIIGPVALIRLPLHMRVLAEAVGAA